jgi:hypothetical protein
VRTADDGRLFARQFDCEGLSVASPDIGAIKRAQQFREILAARPDSPATRKY